MWFRREPSIQPRRLSCHVQRFSTRFVHDLRLETVLPKALEAPLAAVKIIRQYYSECIARSSVVPALVPGTLTGARERPVKGTPLRRR